jgi:hypothetical protein
LSIQSKPVNLPRRFRDKKTVFDRLVQPFEWLWHTVRYRYRRIVRSWAYWRLGMRTYDFDSCYLIEVTLFQLKRLLRACTVDAHCVHDEKDLHSLRVAIRLGERLREDDYDYASRRHAKKWGELHMDFIPLENEPDGFKGSRLDLWRDNVTPETEEQERQEFLRAIEEDDKQRERDARWFFSIMAKYYRDWWD